MAKGYGLVRYVGGASVARVGDDMSGPALLLGAVTVAAAFGGPVLSVVAVVVFGAAEGPLLTAVFAVRNRESPPGLRARVFTTGASVKVTGFAVGAAAAGPLAQWSLPGALATAAVVDAVAVGGCAVLSRRRRG